MVTSDNKTKDLRRVRGEETRQQILKAAVSLASTVGLSKFTLDRVGELAGVSRTLVVFHFKSRENLLTEILGYLNDIYYDGWLKMYETPNISDFERLVLMFDFDLRFACENPEYLSAYVSYWGEDKGRNLFNSLAGEEDAEREREVRTILTRVLKEQGIDLELEPTIRRILSSLAWGFWVESYLEPKVNYYHQATRSMRLVLESLFPNATWPESAQ